MARGPAGDHGRVDAPTALVCRHARSRGVLVATDPL